MEDVKCTYSVFSVNDQLMLILFKQIINVIQLLCYFVGCTNWCGKRWVNYNYLYFNYNLNAYCLFNSAFWKRKSLYFEAMFHNLPWTTSTVWTIYYSFLCLTRPARRSVRDHLHPVTATRLLSSLRMGCRTISKWQINLMVALMLTLGVTVQDSIHTFDLGAISQRHRKHWM